jgi:S1-C subfamily serine protease
MCDQLHKSGKHIVQRVLIISILLALTAGFARSSDLPDIIERVRPAVVGVGLMYPPRQPNRKGDPIEYRGTGFVIGNGLRIITNAHVIPEKVDTDGNQTIAIFSGRGAKARAHPARVLKTDQEHDLALLEIDGSPLPALQLGDSSTVREGQEVAFTGFPIGMVLGLYPVTHRGIVSSITPIARPMENARNLDPVQLKRMRNRFDVFQIDAIAYPGNSGSPVYDPATGRVVGVLNSVFVKESRETVLERPSGISYAIPVHFVHELLGDRQGAR